MVKQFLWITVGQTLIMSKILFKSSLSDYFVDISERPWSHHNFTDCFWVVDSYFKDSNLFPENTIYVESIEEEKNLATCEEVLFSLANRGCTRHDSLVVVGGGFLQDVGTLVSSLYMRGLKWIFAPTTLMAMADSCVGGKSSLNVKSRKNLVGNFYPPKEIHIFTNFINSLSKIDIASGLLEGIKICFAYDLQVFETFDDHLRQVIYSKGNLDSTYRALITQSLQSKKWFLEVDEFDTGERQLLNFGHTFGHALEAASSYSVPHGIAIGLGMLAAIDFAEGENDSVLNHLQETVRELIYFSEYGFSGLKQIDKQLFIDAFNSDKKHSQEAYSLILPNKSKLTKKTFSRNPLMAERVYNAVLTVLDEFN